MANGQRSDDATETFTAIKVVNLCVLLEELRDVAHIRTPPEPHLEEEGEEAGWYLFSEDILQVKWKERSMHLWSVLEGCLGERNEIPGRRIAWF